MRSREKGHSRVERPQVGPGMGVLGTTGLFRARRRPVISGSARRKHTQRTSHRPSVGRED